MCLELSAWSGHSHARGGGAVGGREPPAFAAFPNPGVGPGFRRFPTGGGSGRGLRGGGARDTLSCFFKGNPMTAAAILGSMVFRPRDLSTAQAESETQELVCEKRRIVVGVRGI